MIVLFIVWIIGALLLFGGFCLKFSEAQKILVKHNKLAENREVLLFAFFMCSLLWPLVLLISIKK